MEDGTFRVVLELVTATTAPPAGADLFSVTAQFPDELGPRLAGVQDRVETRKGATSVIEVRVTLPL